VRALLISLLTFVLLMIGAAVGARLRNVLPKHHLGEESRTIAMVGIGFLATLCALVLGLLVASAKTSFDARSDDVLRVATKILLLDRNLRQYGPEADPARELLRRVVKSRVDLVFPNLFYPPPPTTTSAPQSGPIGIEEVQMRLRELTPGNDPQRLVRIRALQLSQDLAETRWLAIAQSVSSIPNAFLVLLIFWLAVIATCCGAFAPRTLTLTCIGVACSACTASALFLILEMDRPFGGLIRVSDLPLREAISYIER
jgi:hypothetical protein